MSQLKRDMHAIRTIFMTQAKKGHHSLSFQEIALFGGEGLWPALKKMITSREIIPDNLRKTYSMAQGYTLEALSRDGRRVYFRAIKGGNTVNGYDPFYVIGMREIIEAWAEENGVTGYYISKNTTIFPREEDALLAYMRFYAQQPADD